MLSKVVGLVAEGKLTEARGIIRAELDSRRETMVEAGRDFIAASIKVEGEGKKPKDGKDPKEPKDGSHDGGAD